MKFFLNFLLAFCGCIFVSCAKSHETKCKVIILPKTMAML